jgi:hypothetical protein
MRPIIYAHWWSIPWFLLPKLNSEYSSATLVESSPDAYDMYSTLHTYVSGVNMLFRTPDQTAPQCLIWRVASEHSGMTEKLEGTGKSPHVSSAVIDHSKGRAVHAGFPAPALYSTVPRRKYPSPNWPVTVFSRKRQVCNFSGTVPRLTVPNRRSTLKESLPARRWNFQMPVHPPQRRCSQPTSSSRCCPSHTG